MMTDQQQPDDDGSYPESWTPWIKRNDPNPIAGLKTATGADATEHTDSYNAYPPSWRI
jgi:hypothetical protein